MILGLKDLGLINFRVLGILWGPLASIGVRLESLGGPLGTLGVRWGSLGGPSLGVLHWGSFIGGPSLGVPWGFFIGGFFIGGSSLGVLHWGSLGDPLGVPWAWKSLRSPFAGPLGSLGVLWASGSFGAGLAILGLNWGKALGLNFRNFWLKSGQGFGPQFWKFWT